MSDFARFCPKCYTFFRDPDLYAKHVEVCGFAKDKAAGGKEKTADSRRQTPAEGTIARSDSKGETRYYIYNTCVHEECYAETGAQAISYTTGVPAALGAKMILSGKWSGSGVFNMEQFDPDPFMAEIGDWGLPWVETFPGPLDF
jgi:hypothetical protein